MKEIENKIVFSYDIKRILSGINAFDYKYDAIPSSSNIEEIRKDFEYDVNKIFNNDICIISEEDMCRVNNLIRGDYPHCNTRQNIY